MLGDLKWMKEIEAGMQNVPDKYRTPDLGEVAPNEEVIGTVPDALLPMLYFSEQLHDEFQQATEAIEKTHAEGGDCSPLHDAAQAKEVAYKNVRAFFTCLLRAELDLTIKYNHLAMRNGNKIVTWSDDATASLIQQILGDGRVKVIPMGNMPDLDLGSRRGD